MRLGHQPGDVVRLVIESDQPLHPHVSLIANPYRVVIDLPAVEWTIGDGEGKGLGYVAKYRYGLFAVDQSRLVLDLDAPATIKRSFAIEPNSRFAHRYVIDLEPAAHGAFVSATHNAKPRTPESRPTAVVPERPQRKPLIVLDAGHGGNDPGARSVLGRYEKDLTLEVAREVQRQLEATGQFHAVLTRERDIYVPLRARTAMARASNADLFISIHADSIADPNHRGGSVYTLSETASDAEAAALAAKENKSDIIAGIDLAAESEEVTSILIDLAQRETMNYSARFASALIETVPREWLIARRPHRFAGFLVLKAPDVPSVLFEIGYLSNRQDAQWIASRKGRQEIAGAITQAARRFFADRMAQQF
ncbi:MAG: N-acetylmuramoyl-L-alanine amidase [Alphaproteobacteria bacterium]|nr:MAG: N-acetylmuramoyl-L-alanine amidase [Alphaproteobacteria bacterium]